MNFKIFKRSDWLQVNNRTRNQNIRAQTFCFQTNGLLRFVQYSLSDEPWQILLRNSVDQPGSGDSMLPQSCIRLAKKVMNLNNSLYTGKHD